MALADSNGRTTRSTTLKLGSFGFPAPNRAGALTQRFFLEGEWHEATGWRDAPRALLEARVQDPHAKFDSFDRIPHRYSVSLAALAVAALAMVAAGAWMVPAMMKGTAMLAMHVTRLHAIPTKVVGGVPGPAAPAPAAARLASASAGAASENGGAGASAAEAASAPPTAAPAPIVVAPIVVPLPSKPKIAPTTAAMAGALPTDPPRAKMTVSELVTSQAPAALAPVLGADSSALDLPSGDDPLPPSSDDPGASTTAAAATPVATDPSGDERAAEASTAPLPASEPAPSN